MKTVNSDGENALWFPFYIDGNFSAPLLMGMNEGPDL